MEKSEALNTRTWFWRSALGSGLLMFLYCFVHLINVIRINWGVGENPFAQLAILIMVICTVFLPPITGFIFGVVGYIVACGYNWWFKVDTGEESN